MSLSIIISDEVREFVENIVVKNSLKSTSKINYEPGSEVGDGFISRTIAVDVKDVEKELHLFLKVPMGLAFHPNADDMFANEIYFYTRIYPAYRSLLDEYDADDGFRNVPKCYGVREVQHNEVIALENLRYKGYNQFKKEKVMDEKHILLTMKTFAKFHAISYAFKDQKRNVYDNFVRNIKKCMVDLVLATGLEKVVLFNMQMIMATLDPVEDKDVLDAKDVLVTELLDIFLTVDDKSNEYSVLTQGDCWCNNMMYLYEEEDQEKPKDVMLVDWQLMRHGSPAIDLGYFFYTVASESTVENYETYLKAYHDELSKRIRILGSDPDVLYPYSVCLDEWKKFAKYGAAMAVFIVKGIMMDKDEMPELERLPEIYEKLLNSTEDERKTLPKMKNEDLYNNRMKVLFKHLIKREFL